MSLADRFRLQTSAIMSGQPRALNGSTYFQEEIERLDRLRPSAQRLSHLYNSSHSNEALFLHVTLVTPLNTTRLAKINATLVEKILERSPENLANIASQWHSFTEQFFTSKGRPVPDWPQYVNVQEELGIFGKTPGHRYGRRIRRLAQEQLKNALDVVCKRYPNWEWAKQTHCYFTAALVPEYFLPSGNISCVPEV
jgi:hypothetical protein